MLVRPYSALSEKAICLLHLWPKEFPTREGDQWEQPSTKTCFLLWCGVCKTMAPSDLVFETELYNVRRIRPRNTVANLNIHAYVHVVNE